MRSVRVKGSHLRVESSSVAPRNWQEFLRNYDKRGELFSFLSLQTSALETESQNIVTHHKDVRCTIGLAPCTQKEADTRIFMPASDAGKVMIRTADTNVFLFAISVQHFGVDEL